MLFLSVPQTCHALFRGGVPPFSLVDGPLDMKDSIFDILIVMTYSGRAPVSSFLSLFIVLSFMIPVCGVKPATCSDRLLRYFQAVGSDLLAWVSSAIFGLRFWQ